LVGRREREDGRGKTEDGRRKREDGRRETGDGRRKTGDGRGKTGDGRREREDGRGKNGRRQKTGDESLRLLINLMVAFKETYKITSDFGLQTSDFGLQTSSFLRIIDQSIRRFCVFFYLYYLCRERGNNSKKLRIWLIKRSLEERLLLQPDRFSVVTGLRKPPWMRSPRH
jgi:hypothetical protein